MPLTNTEKLAHVECILLLTQCWFALFPFSLLHRQHFAPAITIRALTDTGFVRQMPILILGSK